MRNEVSGVKARRIAGRWLKRLENEPYDSAILFCITVGHASSYINLGKVGELKTVLASTLTQAPDKPKRGWTLIIKKKASKKRKGNDRT
jgi:hypothetical protein